MRAVRTADGRVIPCAEPICYVPAFRRPEGWPPYRAINGKCPVTFIPVRGVEDAAPYNNFEPHLMILNG